MRFELPGLFQPEPRAREGPHVHVLLFLLHRGERVLRFPVFEQNLHNTELAVDVRELMRFRVLRFGLK